MKGDNTFQFNLIFQSYVPLLSLEGDDGRRTGRCDPPHDAGAVHKDANANCLKEANLRESFVWLFPSNT